MRKEGVVVTAKEARTIHYEQAKTLWGQVHVGLGWRASTQGLECECLCRRRCLGRVVVFHSCTAIDHFYARHRVTLNIRPTEGSADSLRLVEDRTSGVDAAYFLGGTTNSDRSPGLMSLGRINFTPVWPFYRGMERLDGLAQLKGKRVAVGFAFSRVATQILAAHGVNWCTWSGLQMGPEPNRSRRG
jgi:hypothetical protein